MREQEVLEVCGSHSAAEEVMGLLVGLKFAERGRGVLIAASPADSRPTHHQLETLEEYVFGEAEARDFRRLRALLGAGGHNLAEPPEGIAKRKGPDEETVKRYAKSFLDVADIAQKQSRENRPGGV